MPTATYRLNESKMTSKTLFLKIHRWCGLAAAALILVQATTGVINAYDGIATGQSGHPTGLRVSKLLHSIKETYPNLAVLRLTFPTADDSVYLARLADAVGREFYISLDPVDAEILRAGSVRAFPIEAAARLHYDMMNGKSGLAIIVLIGILASVMAFSGLLYWLPRTGHWHRQLKIDTRASPRVLLRQVHRFIGVTAWILITFSLLTGLVLAVSYYLGSEAEPPPTANILAVTPVVDSAIQMARAEFPGTVIRNVRFRGTQFIDTYLQSKDSETIALHQVRVNLADMSIAHSRHADQDRSLWVTILPLHTGQAIGTSGRLLILFGGVTLFLLSISGPLMWIQKPRRKPKGPKSSFVSLARRQSISPRHSGH